MKSAATGRMASRMIHEPTLPTVVPSAWPTAQPSMPPLWMRISASVSELRARMPVTLMRSSARPASPGQPRASGARTKAPAP